MSVRFSGLSLGAAAQPEAVLHAHLLAVTDSIEVWCLTDQIMFVSTSEQGVHLKPSSHTTQFLVKVSTAIPFSPPATSYSPAENNRCLNQIVSDSGDIPRHTGHPCPVHRLFGFPERSFSDRSRVSARTRKQTAARMRDLAHRKSTSTTCANSLWTGKMISAHDFALLLAEYRIWDSLSESMMAFVLNTLFKVNWQGTHEIADETNSDSPSRDILSHVASLLTQQIRDFLSAWKPA